VDGPLPSGPPGRAEHCTSAARVMTAVSRDEGPMGRRFYAERPRVILTGPVRADPDKTANAVLGPLESAVMDAVWRLDAEATVQAVRDELAAPAAYTTVMTTMERLHRKGYLLRRRSGRAFLYTAAVTRDGIVRRRARHLIAALLSGGAAEPVLSCLVDAVSDQDRLLLDRLEDLVRRKREEGR
jgi:predicted transcriptional regulator